MQHGDVVDLETFGSMLLHRCSKENPGRFLELGVP